MKDKTPNDFQRMIEGKLYNCTASSVLVPHGIALWLADRYNKSAIWNMPWRNFLLRRLIPNSAKGAYIMTPLHVEYGKNITLGKNFFANFNCMMMDCAPITIGDDVMIGANVTLATPMHPLDENERKQQQYPDGFHDLEYAKPIVIGDKVWIGSGATVLGGVTIGEGSIIGAGSVVTRDIPPHSLALGVPCRVVRTLDEKDKMNVWETYQENQTPLSLRDKEKIGK